MITKDYYTDMSFNADYGVDFLLKNENTETMEVIELWEGYFDTIMQAIPPDEDGVFTGLLAEYHVTMAWRDISPEPWQIKDLAFSLEQFKGAKKELIVRQSKKELESYEERSIPMCQDIIEMIEQAIAKNGKVYIIHDPDTREY